MMEWRLACTEVIKYNGDLLSPPDGPAGAVKKKTTIVGKPKAKTIRGKNKEADSSDEDDW